MIEDLIKQGFKAKPTKDELKHILERIKQNELERFDAHFDFYAEHVIGKFLIFKEE